MSQRHTAYLVTIEFRIEGDFYTDDDPNTIREDVEDNIKWLIRKLFPTRKYRWSKTEGRWETIKLPEARSMYCRGRKTLQPTGRIEVVGESITYPDPSSNKSQQR